jgi:hypothetical protein
VEAAARATTDCPACDVTRTRRGNEASAGQPAGGPYGPYPGGGAMRDGGPR